MAFAFNIQLFLPTIVLGGKYNPSPDACNKSASSKSVSCILLNYGSGRLNT